MIREFGSSGAGYCEIRMKRDKLPLPDLGTSAADACSLISFCSCHGKEGMLVAGPRV